MDTRRKLHQFFSSLPVGMAKFVAFDLDATIGSFELIGPWSSIFNVETVENSVVLSAGLKRRMRIAEDMFIEKIKANKKIIEHIFRPNLDELIIPLIKAKRAGKVRAVCIYSNTSETFTMYFAKKIIEERYSCAKFFDCLVDATHPIRKYDWDKNTEDALQPLKTFHGLKKIFRTLCNVKNTIRPENVLFVDDRSEKHHLEAEEKNGLTYLHVESYVPEFSEDVRKEAYMVGLQVLLETNLVDYPPFLSSEIFYRSQKVFDAQTLKTISVNGFFSLLKFVEAELINPLQPSAPFKGDDTLIRKTVAEFLSDSTNFQKKK
jgi:hypothetical protein